MLTGNEIVVVSGLPRSGTSMMMRMLEAGGVPLLVDQVRQADDDNPKGYFEFEPVKALRKDNAWVPQAKGKAVKVISFLLDTLPVELAYKVIFVHRDVEEVIASQRKMLERNGQPSTPEDDARLHELYLKHLAHMERWLARQRHLCVCEVNHRLAIREPQETAGRVNEFLGGSLNIEAMSRAVDPKLHRQRKEA